MIWKLLVATAVAGTLATLTDWLFMGVLFHRAYNTFPEVWRPGVRDGKSSREIMMASLLGYVMTVGVVALCVAAHVSSIGAGLTVGGLAWLAGPPVVIIVNNLFVKIDPRITVAHCMGYAARLLLAGAAAGLALTPAAAA